MYRFSFSGVAVILNDSMLLCVHKAWEANSIGCEFVCFQQKAGVCELYDVLISEGFAMVIRCVIAMMSCLHLYEECYKNLICLGLESFSNLGKGQDSNSRDLI